MDIKIEPLPFIVVEFFSEKSYAINGATAFL